MTTPSTPDGGDIHRGSVRMSDGQEIAYREFRGDRPVLLIHGLSLTGDHWFDLPADLAGAPQQWRPICIDNRGTGRSGRIRRPFRMERMADDCAELLERLDISSAHVVGMSMGGMIAQHLAVRHPEKVAGLVLVATTPCMRAGPWPGRETLKTLFDGIVRRPRSLDPLAKLLLGPTHRPQAAELLAPFIPLAMQRPTPRTTVLAQLWAVARHDVRAALARVRCPTEILVGDADALVPHAHAATLASRISHARLTTLPDIGHGLPLCAPMAVQDALSRTLTGA